jgi:acetyl esterase/lipase
MNSVTAPTVNRSSHHARDARSRCRRRVQGFSGSRPPVLRNGFDPLRDEGDEYARRLNEAGVAVTHRTFPGQFHGFFTMGKLLQQANVAADEIGVWLKALN